VKFRSGWSEREIVAVELARMAEDCGVAALAFHPRTREQGYGGKADWSRIAEVKAAVRIPVIGNGDIVTPEDAVRMVDETGCDAVMIGRAALGNPWIFSRTRHYLDTGCVPEPPGLAERVRVIGEHLADAAAEKGERRAVIEMRKHYRGYLRGLPGSAQMRGALMEPEDLEGVRRILEGRCSEGDA